jgi:hypothetical protein
MEELRYRSAILNFGSAVTFALPTIYPRRKRIRYPLGRRLGGHKTGLDAAENNLLHAPAGNRILAVQPVARCYAVRHIYLIS